MTTEPLETRDASGLPRGVAREDASADAARGDDDRLSVLSRAMDMVNEAVEAMRISQERVAELEAELQASTQHCSEELRAAQAHVLSAEHRAEEAVAWARELEIRATEAESRALKAEAAAAAADARANEAEAWLRRLDDAVVRSFSRLRKHTLNVITPVKADAHTESDEMAAHAQESSALAHEERE
jgi:hypothetical protein